MKSQSGFSALGLLILLPLLISIASVVAAAMALLSTDAQMKQECRTTLIRAQDEIANDLESLMKLNEQASELRLEREEAEAAVVAASEFPPALAAAQAKRLAVIAQQIVLAAKQRRLWAHAKKESGSAPLKAKLKLHRALRERAQTFSSQAVALNSRLQPAEFDVVRRPADSLTPNYEPSPQFSARQEMQVEVEWSITSLLPDWLRKLLGGEDLKMKTTCQATIDKGDEGWRSLLKGDRS